MNDAYYINKNIDRPLVFKGLKAQYIYYYIAVVMVGFLCFVILNASGVSTMITLIITAVWVYVGIQTVGVLSNKFGRDGLMKFMAKRRLPGHIAIDSRDYFLKLKK